MAKKSSAQRTHGRFLARHGMVPMGKMGREELFTGILAAALMCRTSRSAVLEGLGIEAGESDLVHVYTAVEPIDLVLILEDSDGQQVGRCVEVKWSGSKTNAPGWRAQDRGLPYSDQAPSQLDRAHQLVLANAGVHRAPKACRCGYPQTCRTHGCLRGCKDAASGTVAPWQEWPKLYPSQPDKSCGLADVVEAHQAIDRANWSFHFLDYADRSAKQAVVGVCSPSWKSARMSTLARVLRSRFEATSAHAEKLALEPLLRALYCDDLHT